MSTLVYSKKQLQPLIDKYAINAESNTVFAKIIQMFDGQPNYQLWGVKVVFSKATTIENLEAIKEWADNNGQLIKMLSKNGNLICYSASKDFSQLAIEIRNLNAIAFVKHMISVFNTDQRKVLTSATNVEKVNSLNALNDANFIAWHKLFTSFSKLSAGTKKIIIGRASAERDGKTIFNLLTSALAEKYKWNKDDLLAFVSANTPDCDIVVNDGSIVVLNVKNYHDSNTLCCGRTGWCITSSEAQWKNYVISRNAQQYFFFDFSKGEKDELAHIGFTVTKENGFYAAHSTSDQSLMGNGMSYHGKNVNIQQALTNAGVNLGAFLKMKPLTRYKWDADSLRTFVKKNDNRLAIAFDKDNRIIVNALNRDGLMLLCQHTYIKVDNIVPDNKDVKAYILFDFNLKGNDDKSIVMALYRKDNYKVDTLNMMVDAFGTNVKDDNYFRKIGIRTENYLNREKVNPSILLHKLIDEGDSDGACQLIDNEKELDVNYAFNDRRPIFSAIDAKLHKVVGKIISHDKFDCNVDDGFGESLIQNLLFTFYLDYTSPLKKEDEKPIRDMLSAIIDSGRFDLNYIDDNEDTAINIACMHPSMNWLVEKLAAMPDVNVNVRNDIHWTALGNAIRKNNVDAVKILGRRPDLEVTEEDRKLAKQNGIDLDKFLKPQPFAKADEVKVEGKATADTTTVVTEAIDADKYDEIFKKVFAIKN